MEDSHYSACTDTSCYYLLASVQCLSAAPPAGRPTSSATTNHSPTIWELDVRVTVTVFKIQWHWNLNIYKSLALQRRHLRMCWSACLCDRVTCACKGMCKACTFGWKLEMGSVVEGDVVVTEEDRPSTKGSWIHVWRSENDSVQLESHKMGEQKPNASLKLRGDCQTAFWKVAWLSC